MSKLAEFNDMDVRLATQWLRSHAPGPRNIAQLIASIRAASMDALREAGLCLPREPGGINAELTMTAVAAAILGKRPLDVQEDDLDEPMWRAVRDCIRRAALGVDVDATRRAIAELIMHERFVGHSTTGTLEVAVAQANAQPIAPGVRVVHVVQATRAAGKAE